MNTKTSKPLIFIFEKFSNEAFEYLQHQGNFNLLSVQENQNHCELPWDQVEALLIRSRTKINEDLLKKAPRLQVIITATSGFDHIDLEATQRWGVIVMHTPMANVESASQLTWALALCASQKIIPAHNGTLKNQWRQESLRGRELSGLTYGIVGLGRIGSRVTEFAKVFGMEVIAYDPYLIEEDFSKKGVAPVSLENVLRRSDILSLHVPRTEETHGLLGKQELSLLKEDALLINTSRGGVIDETALAEWLHKNPHQKMAALDVFTEEPLPCSSPLRSFECTLLTPHIGAHTEQAFFRASSLAAQKLISFFFEGNSSDTLPPVAPWYGATSNKI